MLWKPASRWQRLADWWSFHTSIIEEWLFPTPDTPEDRVIRGEGERIRKAYPEQYAHEQPRRWLRRR